VNPDLRLVNEYALRLKVSPVVAGTDVACAIVNPVADAEVPPKPVETTAPAGFAPATPPKLNPEKI